MTQHPEHPEATPPTPAAEIPRFAALEKQLALIGIQEDRLSRLRVREHLSDKYARAVTENIRLLQALYAATFRTQQELGLAPAYQLGPRLPETDPAVRDLMYQYPFITAEEARNCVMMDELEKAGKINMGELYEVFGAIFRYEQEQLAKRGDS
jgi:hypothetical protein